MNFLDPLVIDPLEFLHLIFFLIKSFFKEKSSHSKHHFIALKKISLSGSGILHSL